MAYITREDGVRFIIPSYRDTLSIKKASLLKKEIMLLSSNYGEYITLQKKNVNQYEVAFSSEPGYLLGECVWHNFNRPFDMIYCEAIPNTFEAILVIVKSGSVYLDGSFPIDSIPEELIIFKTQQNSFAIYVHGDVPISEKPEAGKFTFDAASVRSFTVLDTPVFPKLPTVKVFQLQLVDAVLKAQGVGAIPTKQVVIALIALGLLYAAWQALVAVKEEAPVTVAVVEAPISEQYRLYSDTLTSPDPGSQIEDILNKLSLVYLIPGWFPNKVVYTPRASNSITDMEVGVVSHGTRTPLLLAWARKYNADVNVRSEGIFVVMQSLVARRAAPTKIFNLQEVLATLLDGMSYVLPGNSIELGNYIDRKNFTEVALSINFSNISPVAFSLIGKALKGMPVVLTKAALKMEDGNFSGQLTLKALGN